MLIFTLTTFILFALAKVLILTANWTFTNSWHPSQFKVANFPIEYLASSQLSSKAVWWGSSRPEKRYPIQQPHVNQDNGVPSFSNHSANPKQSRPGITSKENRHPIQPIPSARPTQLRISQPPHPSKPHTDHFPSTQPAPASVTLPHCSMVLFSGIPLSAFRMITNTSSNLVTAHTPLQLHKQNNQPNKFLMTHNDCYLAQKDNFLAPKDSYLPSRNFGLATNKMCLYQNISVNILPSSAKNFIPFARPFKYSCPLKGSRPSTNTTLAKALNILAVQ